MSTNDLTPPTYPIDEHLRLLLASQTGAPPVQERPGFLDRLAAGLAQIQTPQGGRAGDQFGASLLTSAARGFGGNRLAARDAEFKRQMSDFERGKAAKGAEAQARLAALGKDYDLTADIAKSKANKTPSTDVTVTAEMALANPGLKDWVGRAVPRDWMKPQSPEDATSETRRQLENDRDYKLRVAAEDRQRKKDAADAAKTGSSKPPTVWQERAQLFYSRAKEAAVNAEVGGLEGRMLKKAWSLAQPPALQGDPDTRAYWRAMEGFSLALNRLESGAAIAPTEFAKVRQLYFVTPGDQPDDVKAKKKMRETILESLWRMQAPDAKAEQAGAGATVTPADLWEP